MSEDSLEFRFLKRADIESIVPFVQIVNTKTPVETISGRLEEMFSQNYKCLGIYSENQLVGICGLWFLTRHYCGKTMEPDHVVIHPDYQGRGFGNKLFEWLFDYARQNGFEATELNSYVNNTGSHKFYYNLGYVIKGYHFVKILD